MTKLMLVEDDNNLREIYGARLAAEGYEIVSAKDGEEALAMAVKEKPDLIISDVMMPKISGFDMLDILRSTPETKNTKVVMMTALSQKEDQERGEKLGADRYLVKSQVTLEDVVRVVAEVLGGEAAAPTAAPPADDSSSDDSSPSDDSSGDEPAEEATAEEPQEPEPEPEPKPEADAEPIPEPEPETAAGETDKPDDPVTDAPPEPVTDTNEDQASGESQDEKKNDQPASGREPVEADPPKDDIPPKRKSKVIAPINSPDTKPNIHDLLAKEEANAGTPGVKVEAQQQPAVETPETVSASEEQSEVEEQIANFVTSAPDGPPAQVEPQADPPEATDPQPVEEPEAAEPLLAAPEPEPETETTKPAAKAAPKTKDGVDPHDIAL
jgi:CheY-like chemotaxis protein